MQCQQVAPAAEVKAVLDSWVRFEQARLVKTIVDNVLKNISEEKTQKDVLAWAVSEVDREYLTPQPRIATVSYRDPSRAG